MSNKTPTKKDKKDKKKKMKSESVKEEQETPLDTAFDYGDWVAKLGQLAPA